MKVYNVRKEVVQKLLKALEEMGVCKADIRAHMDFARDGTATYYARNFMEFAALKSVQMS